MDQKKLLEVAQSLPEQPDPWRYAESIWILKNKGYSTRRIAKILTENHVPVEHTTISRILKNTQPSIESPAVLICDGGNLYIQETGRPLIPYGEFRTLRIQRRDGHVIKLDGGWVEYQFHLSSTPPRCWLRLLHEELHAPYNPESAEHLNSPLGFEMKFSGTLASLRFLPSNPQETIEKVVQAMKNVFYKLKKLPEISEMEKEANRTYRSKTLDRYTRHPKESDDDVISGHEEAMKKSREALADKLNSILKSLF